MAVSAEAKARAAKALTEFLGTLFLCLTISLAARSSPIAPIAIGCVLAVSIFAGGHVSGAHYNPAVTLAVLVRGGKMCLADGALYVLSQVTGAFVAALFSWVLIGKDASGHPVVGADAHLMSVVLCEFLVTFALSSVVLHTATSVGQEGNSHFGLAIGFTVLSGAVAVGGVSGGCFNPAVGSMSLLYGADAAKNVWAYWVAPLLGGATAGAVFRVVAPREDQPASLNWKVTTACIVELVGTMMLCFVVGNARGALAPLAIGSMLMSMIYMGGYISGAHYNPAVTVAVFTRSLLGAGGFSLHQALGYFVAQLVGAILGALAAWGARVDVQAVGVPARPASSSIGQAFLGELLATFLLAYVVLHTATASCAEGNSYFGFSIGMTVTAMACAVGPISGGAFNPAVGITGLVLRGFTDFWIYWVACPLGGALAAVCFSVQTPEDFRGVAGKAVDKSVEDAVIDFWAEPSARSANA